MADNDDKHFLMTSSDKHHLSDTQNCITNAHKIKEYARKALSENTWKAYESDILHFFNWGGSIPSTPDFIASYLADFAGELATSTLSRRLAAINKLHEVAGHTSPTHSEIVRLTLRGIKREHKTAQKQASPLLRDDLISIIRIIPDTIRGKRDKAILLIGFAAALRRSEIVALNTNDVEFVTEGLILTIRQSKTDRDGKGRKIAIPKAANQKLICPVTALQDWTDHFNPHASPLFINAHRGTEVQNKRLSDRSISLIIKKYVEQIGLDPSKYSGHSLRSGFISTCARMGIPEWRIMRQSGHRSHQTLMSYIRDARLFDDHPLNNIF